MLNKMFRKDQKGFTLIELVMVLGVLSVLTAIIVPVMVHYIQDAQIQRAKADVKEIGAAIMEFNRDMKEWPIWESGTATKPTDTKYDVLKTEAGDETGPATGITFDTTTNADSLDDQLVTNDPVYPTSGVRRWLGPYLENITEDPWGNKYYVTVKYLQPEFRSRVSEKAVFVISAGPNEEIDTNFEQDVNAFTVGGDDIAHRIR